MSGDSDDPHVTVATASRTAGHVYADTATGTYVGYATSGDNYVRLQVTRHTRIWTPTADITAEMLMVAGGGGGGGTSYHGGGGGAGGVITQAKFNYIRTTTVVL